MSPLKKWGLPVLTGIVVLAALLLPQQLSALRDRHMVGNIHLTPLAEDELAFPAASLPQRLELLGRAVWYPDLEIYTATQTLDGMEAAGLEGLSGAVADLRAWGVLPEDYPEPELLGGSRVIYVDAASGLSAGMLYLQAMGQGKDDFWLVIDEETGLPVWIDCTLRSAWKSLPSAETLCRSFLEGLGLQPRQLDGALFVVEEAGGLVYSAPVSTYTGRLCVEPLGFERELFYGPLEGGSVDGNMQVMP